MQILKKLNYIFEKKQKIQLLILFFVILIGTALELMGVTIILPFINGIMDPEYVYQTDYLIAINNIFHFKDYNQFMAFLGIAIIIVYIVKNVYISVMYYQQYRFTFNNQRKMAYRMLDCYMRQPYYFHRTHNSSELIRNVNSDTVMMFHAILAVLQLLTEVLVCIVLGAFLFIMDKSITIGICVFLGGFAVVFAKGFKRYLENIGQKDRKYNAEIVKWLQQSFGGIKETKVSGREEFFLNQFDHNYGIFAECERKYRFMQVAPRPIMEAVCIGGLMLVVVLKLLNGTTSEYFVTTISVFAIAAFRVLPSFNRITNYLSVIMFNYPALDAVYQDLKEIEALQATYKVEDYDVTPLKLNEAIRVKDMTFVYPDGDLAVLEHINLTISRKQSVAFIGPSGAGKTTLADIILGALEPTSGTVYADEKDIFQNMTSWHKSLGYIPQSIYLMDDTVKNNVAFGIPVEEIDDAKLWKALEQAQLKEFIQSLDKGLETLIGESGVRLSGGQRQRIGIARALYNDPEVLVLDEATSALDSETETAVMEAIEALSGNKTLIIIAHRISTIQNCDIVYEVKEGKVVEAKKPKA